jgi:hypothetical protein
MTIEVYGNWGKLICDGEGWVINYDRSDSDSETITDGYYDIVRVDLKRYRNTYVRVPSAIDIVHIGYWYGKYNQYADPCE